MDPQYADPVVDPINGRCRTIHEQQLVARFELTRINPATLIVNPERMTIGRDDLATFDRDIDELFLTITHDRIDHPPRARPTRLRLMDRQPITDLDIPNRLRLADYLPLALP